MIKITMENKKENEHAKVTWKDIYEDFKNRHPTLGKQSLGFEPYEYATIKIWIKGERPLSYNYDTKIAKFIK